MKIYKRDKRSPEPSSALASKVMSSIRNKNTNPEIQFRKLLTKEGLRGYRLHYKIAGKPDIVFSKRKLAIFIHGCYWHRCPKCDLPIPRSNAKFWLQKFEKNILRDIAKKKILQRSGWRVFVVWECEIKNNPRALIKKIQKVF